MLEQGIAIHVVVEVRRRQRDKAEQIALRVEKKKIVHTKWKEKYQQQQQTTTTTKNRLY